MDDKVDEMGLPSIEIFDHYQLISRMEKLYQTKPVDLLVMLITTAVIYFLVILYIRMLGKRSTSQLNNFDWIVTVSVGSLISSTIVREDVSLTEGGSAILLMLLLQYSVTKIMCKSKTVLDIVKSTPKLLLFQGEFLEESLRNERILKPEIYASIRQQGFKSMNEVYAVVLESNSKLSIIGSDDSKKLGTSLMGVAGLPSELEKELDAYL